MSIDKTFKTSNLIYFALIVSLGLCLRIIWLKTIPNGFFVDEASNGYDAYSLLYTQRDHYGTFMPLFLRAFDDYREAFFIYLMIPFIKFFGLNEVTTRLPATLIGTGTIIVIYYLSQELFEQDKRVALMSSLFLALSPWHLHFSRTGWRAIIFPFFFSLALLLFLRSLKNNRYLIPSGFCFGLSFWSYTSARVFVSLFLLGLCIIYWQHLWQNRQKTLIAAILFFVVYIPLLRFWLSPEGMSRLGQVGFQFDKLTLNYLSYFDPKFLFFKGDPNLRHSAPNLGQLHYFEFIPLIFGLIGILRKPGKTRIIIVMFLLLYPFPGALTEPQHAIRSIIGTILFALISGYGMTQIIKGLETWFKSSKVLPLSLLILTICMLSILSKFYFIDYPIKVTGDWQYGMREAIAYAQNSPIQCAVMKRKDNWVFEDRSYGILTAFYTQYSPQEYQHLKTHPWNRTTDQPDYTLGKFTLMTITPESKLPEQCLFIVYPDENPVVEVPGYKWKEVHSIKDTLGKEHFKIFEVTRL